MSLARAPLLRAPLSENFQMARDDRFYAFIIAHTPRSSARIRRFCVEKRSIRILALLAALGLSASFYGFYGLTQQAAHFRTEIENQRLRAENEKQRQELNQLSDRVEAVEDTSRKLAEKSGVTSEDTVTPGSGGPGRTDGRRQFGSSRRKDGPART